MAKEKSRIESIGRSEFLDDEALGWEPRRIKSGRGRVGRDGSGRRQLEPEIICGPDGRLGWRVSIPGSRPLTTPAVLDGRVFAGGGFGSHEFYTFDSATGQVLWKLRTKDDGPTAATVLGDRVAFNTESCTVYVVDASNGRVLWERWLGDPLMAQTAIDGSRLFMAFPDRKSRHHLAAFDLETGREIWRRELATDVITAPIVAEGSVFASTLDGTVCRLDEESGEVSWSLNHGATSAPWVHRGRLFMSLREEVKEAGRDESVTAEGYDTVAICEGTRKTRKASSRRRAEYLKFKASAQAFYQLHDASVGFAAAPASAKLAMAKNHLGVGHVASVWSFQGSRPEAFDDGVFCVLDDVIQRLELDTKKPLWRARVEPEAEGRHGRLLSPPALSASRLYVTSSLGDLFALDRQSGEELWALNVGAPILAQPALGEGKVFFGTADGVLYAFESDDGDSAGWPMWGGGPGHNGPVNGG